MKFIILPSNEIPLILLSPQLAEQYQTDCILNLKQANKYMALKRKSLA